MFSLGVMAYEMLTGKLPYGGASFLEIGMKQAAGEAQVDIEGLPRNVAAVIRRAIAYEKDARPESAVAFAEALRDAGSKR